MGFDKFSFRLPDGRTVLETSCAALAEHPAVTQLVLVCGGNRAACEAIAAACPKPCAVVQGGATRADSVRNGLAAATGELVAIHDAARPFISASVITAALTAAAETAQPRRSARQGYGEGRRPVGPRAGHAGPRHALRCADTAVLPPRTLHPGACRRHGEKRALSPTIAACLSWRACRLR